MLRQFVPGLLEMSYFWQGNVSSEDDILQAQVARNKSLSFLICIFQKLGTCWNKLRLNLFYLWNYFSANIRICSSLNIFHFNNFSFVGLQNPPSIISLRSNNGIYFSYTFILLPNMQNRSFSFFKS